MRKKERIMAFDVLQPDTLHQATERVCRNFICYETNVKENLAREDRKGLWKQDVAIQKQFDLLCGHQTELREGLGNIGLNLVSLLPVSPEKSVKPSIPYVYRILDYSAAKTSPVFTTKNEVLQYIQKKIKSKNVIMHYDGKTETGEFNPERIGEILSTLEEDTIDFDIASVGRGGVEGDIILITIYKNLLKF